MTTRLAWGGGLGAVECGEEAFEARKHLFGGLLAIHDDHQRRPGSQDIVLAVKPAYLPRCEGADGIWRPARLKRQRMV